MIRSTHYILINVTPRCLLRVLLILLVFKLILLTLTGCGRNISVNANKNNSSHIVESKSTFQSITLVGEKLQISPSDKMILTVIRDIYDIYWAFPTSIIAKVEGKTIFIKEGSRVFIGTASNESEKDHSIVGRAVFNTIKSIYKYKSPSPSIPRPTNPTHKEKSEEDVKYVYHYNDNQIYSAMYIKDNLMIGQSNRKEINQTSTIEVKEIVFSTEN